MKVAGACGRNIDACDYYDNRVVLPRHPAILFKDKSEGSVLLLPLYALLWSFVARSASVPLQSVVIPETVFSVDSLLLCHYK